MIWWTENNIGEDGTHLLYDSLECNSTLTELEIEGEHIIIHIMIITKRTHAN